MWWQNGYTPLPVKPDGSKAPAVQSWTAYQKTRPTLPETLELFKIDSDGIGLICGAVSGGLEMLELEGRAVEEGYYRQLVQAFTDHGQDELWSRINNGYVEETPSGGMHWYYRTRLGRTKRNTKLARRPGRDGPEVLIETRGEGGFTVVAPSAGRTHGTGKHWLVLIGQGPENIPVLSEDERDTIHAIASTLDQMPVMEPPPPRNTHLTVAGELRPGDHFNQQATWQQILEPHGWTIHKHYGGNLYGWRKPNKSHPGISATTGRNDADRIFVFSTSTIFESERPYSKFGAYALLNHQGDYAAAARELRKQGYGATNNPKELAAVEPHLNGHTIPNDPTVDLEPKLETFWETRPILQHIRDFAYARLASPWAVLGVVLVRTLHHIPPWVTLPALIGGHGNLNLFIALVSQSGGGKGAAEAAARDCIDYYMKDPILVVPAGSGEGLTHVYGHWENRTEGVIRDRNAVVFTSPEVDALAALSNRQGSTLMAQLRQAFSGETLGFAYADKTRKVIIQAHSYRFGYIVGVQPERAAALLDQTDGGTPQRFIWLPATDPNIGIECEEPIIKTVNWPHPKTGDITMPDTVKQEIRDAHIGRVQGNGHSLDGHAVYAREKAAYALALLAGRIDMNEEDWQLAGQIMVKSDITRTLVQVKLQQKLEAVSTAKALGDAHRQVIRSDVVDSHEVQEAAKAITRKLSRHAGEWVAGKAVKDVCGKRRDYFHEATEVLLEAGQIEVEQVQRRGQDGVRLRLSKSSR